MQRQGDELDGKIRKAEKEVRALEAGSPYNRSMFSLRGSILYWFEVIFGDKTAHDKKKRGRLDGPDGADKGTNVRSALS